MNAYEIKVDEYLRKSAPEGIRLVEVDRFSYGVDYEVLLRGLPIGFMGHEHGVHIWASLHGHRMDDIADDFGSVRYAINEFFAKALKFDFEGPEA